MQAIDLKIKGIKCDNPDCDFKDDSVVFEDYKVWLDRPCPKCGANLLTEADLKAVKKLRRFVIIVNFIYKPFLKFMDTTKRKSGEMEMNGTGEMIFKVDHSQP